MKYSFTVSVDVPMHGQEREDVREYVKTAVEGWTGGMDPDAPMGCQDIKCVVKDGWRTARSRRERGEET